MTVACFALCPWTATQAFEPADPGGARFLEQPAAACPRPVTQAGRDFLELLNELCLELVPHEDKIWRARRLKLGCAIGHCLVVVTCRPARARRRALSRSKKNSRPGSKRAAQLGTMCSSITLIHSLPLIFRPGSTKCNVRAMSRAPMMPETIIARVVAVCDAVNRSGVGISNKMMVWCTDLISSARLCVGVQSEKSVVLSFFFLAGGIVHQKRVQH